MFKKIYNKKLIIKVIVGILVLFALFCAYVSYDINNYLKSYGYGTSELSKTLMVYFHLSKGFTVKKVDDEKTIFIGSSNHTIYNDIFFKNGYTCGKSGNMIMYEKNGDIIRMFEEEENHWFQIYLIEGKIEEYI